MIYEEDIKSFKIKIDKLSKEIKRFRYGCRIGRYSKSESEKLESYNQGKIDIIKEILGEI